NCFTCRTSRQGSNPQSGLPRSRHTSFTILTSLLSPPAASSGPGDLTAPSLDRKGDYRSPPRRRGPFLLSRARPMPRRRPPPANPWSNDPLLQAAALVWHALHEARTSPNTFAELCFPDPAGRPLRQARVHRELQASLAAHRRALIELPRDHGKSVQVCIRLLWELGRDPALRVKIVCASDALAAERCRFLRDALTGNARLRLVFPHLSPTGQHPWTATHFT